MRPCSLTLGLADGAQADEPVKSHDSKRPEASAAFEVTHLVSVAAAFVTSARVTFDCGKHGC